MIYGSAEVLCAYREGLVMKQVEISDAQDLQGTMDDYGFELLDHHTTFVTDVTNYRSRSIVKRSSRSQNR